MSKLKLYLERLSQPCRAVEIFLRVNKIQYEPVLVALSLGEHKTDEFTKINKFQKVPVISDNGFNLAESVAILRYLCREKKVSDHWYPVNSKKQARVDEFLEWHHIELRGTCALYVRQNYFNTVITGRSDPEEMQALVKKRMIYGCNLIENKWLKGGNKFLIGDDISIADLIGVCELEELKLTGYKVKEGRPKLAEWMERVRVKTNPHYDDIHSKLNSLSKIKDPEDIINFLTSKL